MKHIIFTLVFMFGLFAQSENWMRLQDIDSGSVAGYELKSSCESNGNYECLKIDGISIDEKKVGLSDEDNFEKPIFNSEGEIISFEKKKTLIDDENKIVKKSLKLTEKAEIAKIQKAKNDIQSGQDIIAHIVAKNRSKQANKSQVKQLVNTYAQIQMLLQSGSLETALDTVKSISADGVLITEIDKQELISLIQSKLQ